uniref:Tyrosine-protein kinase n=1 Tax=Pavo cristatus TaxID=9049 RepID=A0A8C9F819_PAVCR
MNNCVLLEEQLIKKSQQKRRTSPSNFKVRFFVLTKSKLAYYEHRHGKKRTLKGSVELSRIKCVEIVKSDIIIPCQYKYPFQVSLSVGYTDNNNSLVSKYHPDFWIDGKWRCCAQTEKMAVGCIEYDPTKTGSCPSFSYFWYTGKLSLIFFSPLILLQGREGAFMVRDSRQPGMYTVSVFTKALSTDNNPVIKHYHINETTDFPKRYYLAEKYVFDCIPELINYHQHNAGGLVTRLRYAVSSWKKKAPITAGLSYGKLVINPSELTRVQEIGSGQFGVVYLGYWLEKTKVAIKTIREGAMSEEDFIEEAKVLMKLSHPKLVQLYGVCFENTPICLVFEFMEHGCLSDYLRSQRGSFSKETLLGMCLDVCEGMAYLEQNSVIHRDLAARNCLVGESHVVKVSDFGMSRIVLDDQYTSSTGTKFPVKWSAPEVFSYSNYSTKSDVWSFGVLMWEVFSEGKMPYENRTNGEVVEEINAGFRLYKPKLASKAIYEVMSHCWSMRKEDRPSFSLLLYQLSEVSEFDL